MARHSLDPDVHPLQQHARPLRPHITHASHQEQRHLPFHLPMRASTGMSYLTDAIPLAAVMCPAVHQLHMVCRPAHWACRLRRGLKIRPLLGLVHHLHQGHLFPRNIRLLPVATRLGQVGGHHAVAQPEDRLRQTPVGMLLAMSKICLPWWASGAWIH